jgi:hypothetical protein
LESIEQPRWEDMIVRYDQMWSWIRQTGLTEAEENGDWARVVSYVRRKDDD